MIEHIQFNTSSLKDQTDQVPEKKLQNNVFGLPLPVTQLEVIIKFMD